LFHVKDAQCSGAAIVQLKNEDAMRRSLFLFALLTALSMMLLGVTACSSACDCPDGDDCLVDGDIDAEMELDSEPEADVDEAPLDGDLDDDVESELELEAETDGDLDFGVDNETEAEEDAAEDDEEIEDVDPGYDNYYGSLRYQTEATGFFRVEQIEGQWWLITPDGHPFFSTGINVVSYTGSCSHDGVCHYRDHNDANYESRESWADIQLERLWNWGWNTIGAWSDWRYFQNRYPYTIIIYVADKNMTENGPLDFFSNEFRERARQRITDTVTPNVDDPYLIGYFTDNEMHWGYDLYQGVQLFNEYIKFDAATPGKQRLVQLLRERYGTFSALGVDFKTDGLTSFDDLLTATELKSRETEGALATKAAFNGLVAEAYFSITDGVFREIDQNHLNLGVRFVSQLIPKSVIQAAGRYVDVMSINWYDLIPGLADVMVGLNPENLPVNNWLQEQYEAGGRPIMVSEWGFRSKDGGPEMNSYPPIYPTLETTEERADAYEAKFQGMLDREWFIGQHWFQYTNQPPEGRFDGEDNNFGVLTEEDIPYDVLVERSAMMHAKMYRRLPPMSTTDGDASAE
jgi:hypothetical protein